MTDFGTAIDSWFPEAGGWIFIKGGGFAGRPLPSLLFHLWPLTLAELGDRRITFDAFWENPLQVAAGDRKDNRDVWAALSRFSGFPEPYLLDKDRRYTPRITAPAQGFEHMVPLELWRAVQGRKR